MQTTPTMADLMSTKAKIDDSRRKDVIDLLRRLGADRTFDEGWEDTITAHHIVIMPRALVDARPDLYELPYVRAQSMMPDQMFVVDGRNALPRTLA